MTRAELSLHFQAVHHTGQQLGWSGIYSTASVVGEMTLPGATPCAFSVTVTRSGGIRDVSNLEVGPVSGYDGPLDRAAFRRAVERYYRGTVETRGGGEMRRARGTEASGEDDTVRRSLVVRIPIPLTD